MGLLSKLKGKNEPEIASRDELTCLHVALAPQWDSPEKMGIESAASGWSCGACGEKFTPAEARRLRETEASRLRSTLEAN